MDHHFTKRFDAFAGIAYSYVSGGLAIAIPHGPGVPYNSRQQLCSDNRWSFHLLIAGGPPSQLCHPERSAVSEAKQRGVEGPLLSHDPSRWRASLSLFRLSPDFFSCDTPRAWV